MRAEPGTIPAPIRLLVALDVAESWQDLAAYVMSIATKSKSTVHVVHVLECSFSSDLALDPTEDARDLVESAVSALRMKGINATGAVRDAAIRRVAPVLVEEAEEWGADVVLLHAQRFRGWRRVYGHGVRERFLRRSFIPTVLVGQQSFPLTSLPLYRHDRQPPTSPGADAR